MTSKCLMCGNKKEPVIYLCKECIDNRVKKLEKQLAEARDELKVTRAQLRKAVGGYELAALDNLRRMAKERDELQKQCEELRAKLEAMREAFDKALLRLEPKAQVGIGRYQGTFADGAMQGYKELNKIRSKHFKEKEALKND